MKCKDEVMMSGELCKNKECRQWISCAADNNCLLISIEKNGPLTLQESAARLGISYVRVKQIQDAAIKKLLRVMNKK
tara:strand:+ start:840 stop:1070 length:231 start_codon:yes stop_codon:yes gene_type:complete